MIIEFIRGPYAGLYARQPDNPDRKRGSGRRQSAPAAELRWVNTSASLPPATQAAKTLFAANCGVCHAESGVNGIDQRLAGRSADGINAMLGITQTAGPVHDALVGSEQNARC